MNYTCNLEIPEEIIKKLGIREQEISSAFRNELAAFFFEKKLLSFGQARRFSGMPKWNFMDFLRERKIPLNYDIAEYEEDSKTIERFL